MSINQVHLCGHLGHDPELRYTQSGKPVANFSVATSDKWTGQDGTHHERTEWHTIVVWGKVAELCGQYLSKGSEVTVLGSIRSEKYEKDGVERKVTKIVAQRVQFHGKKGDRDDSDGYNQGPGGEMGGAQGSPIDDDIPF